MASTPDFLRFVIEQTDKIEVSYKKMMGEYLLYRHGVLFGGIYDNRLLLKPTEQAKRLLPAAELVLPYPGAKPMLLCDFVDDAARLSALIKQITEQGEHRCVKP